VAARSSRSRQPAAGPFFAALVQRLAPALPIELRGFEHRRMGRIMKFHYGHPETHFEAWHHAGAGRMEVGLHFEGSAARNAAAADFFGHRMLEVKGGLPSAELEPWERGWVRLYETFPAAELDLGVLDGTAMRLADYMTILQPILITFWSERNGPD